MAPTLTCRENHVTTSFQDISQSVLEGNGVGWLNVKKVRRLMECESLRLFLLQRLNQSTQEEGNDYYVEDIVSTTLQTAFV